MAIDKDTLLKAKIAAKTIEIPGVGEFRYRGLSRKEALAQAGEDPKEVMKRLSISEAKLFALCVVEPALTEDEWAQVQDNYEATTFEPLAAAIAEASGADPEAAKQAYKQFRSGQ